MRKFRQTETVPCWVTWIREVEAQDEKDAATRILNGEAQVISEEIGNCLDAYQSTIEIHPWPPGPLAHNPESSP